MSVESLAALRKHKSEELRQLAEEHLKHDLNESDREILKSAAKKVSTHATIGSVLGIAFGVYTAFRLRQMRLAYFKAFRAMEKPVEVKFADGRTQAVPDITTHLQPSKWADAATFTFFTLGGLFIGGEFGVLSGTSSAARAITQDPQTKDKIETAFRNYRIDLLKSELRDLEGKSKYNIFL